MRVAAFDIGSNTLLMLIADVGDDGALKVLTDVCEFGRLGQGVGSTNKLADEATERSLAILKRFHAVMDEHAPTRIGAVGTQALRAATNASSFLTPAAEILDAPIEVISGEREAELTYRATAAAFPELATTAIVLADVGGASTEVVVGRKDNVDYAVSIPIGAVTLAEKHLRSDPATADETKGLFADIDQCIASHLSDFELPTNIPLVGTAGTATTFATVELRLATFDADRVQGLSLPRARIERHVARFLELTVAEKRKLTGLEPQRADVIAAGAAIYARLMSHLEAPSFLVSGRGVRFGLAAELASA